VTYGTDLLMEEVSYVAYHFHWPWDQILDLEHPLRRDFVARIAGMNAAVNASVSAAAGAATEDDAAGDGW
jgi:hypothetical protein